MNTKTTASLDLFGSPIKVESGSNRSKSAIDSLGGKQQALFAKSGLPGQMQMWADVGVPDEMVMKQAK